ncbi:MAG: Ig-like domain repeat protein [Isosphaerales bacterium]
MISLFGFGLPARKTRQRWDSRVRPARPIIERLEDRTLLASVAFATYFAQSYDTAFAVDSAGDVFFSHNGNLLKYSSSGQQLWAVQPASINIQDYGLRVPGVGGAMALDGAGNVYLAGGGTVEKFDGVSGAFIWGRSLVVIPNLSDTSYHWAATSTGLAVDPEGNVYLTGAFAMGDIYHPDLTLAFGTPGFGVNQPLNLYQNSDTGVASYVVELDHNGQLLWDGGLLNVGPGPYFNNVDVQANSIATDASGNVYVAGGFAGTANFDPNGGQYILTSSNANLSASAGNPLPPDAFVLKLNSAHQLVWVDDMRADTDAYGSSSAGEAVANAMATDPAGDVYLTGGFSGSVYLDPAAPGSYLSGFNSQGFSGAFVEKLDTNGVFQWATQATAYSAAGAAIALDSAGDVYTTGLFIHTAYFGSIEEQPPDQSGYGAYVWQLDPDGTTTWVGYLDSPNTYPFGDGIGVDAAGDIFVKGKMQANPGAVPEYVAVPVYFYPGSGNPVLMTTTFGQDFLLKLVQNTPPTADAGGPYSITQGDSLALNAGASSDPDGDPLTYSWDINGDGVYGDATGVSPTLTWAQLQSFGIGPGTYNVSVQVNDGTYVATSPATTLTVKEPSPVPTISPPNGGVVGQDLSFVFGVSNPSPADQAAGFTYAINWGDGSPVQTVTASPGNGSGTTVSHAFAAAGLYPVSVTVADEDGEQGTWTESPAFAVAPAATTVTITSVTNPSVNGQEILLTATVTADSPGAGIPTGTITFQDGFYQFPLSGSFSLDPTGTLTLGYWVLSATYAGNLGDHALTFSYAGDSNFVASSATVVQTINALNSTNLQQVLSQTNSVTIEALNSDDATAIVNAVNGLAPQPTPVTVALILSAGTYTDLTASPPTGVTLVISGSGSSTTTVVGQSPALTVTSGNVVVSGVTLTTATDAPTILVSGGSLTLRSDVIRESTGFSDAAISLLGGTVDLGTTASPGNNTLNVNGPGELVHNATASPAPDFGNTLEVNGTPLAASFLSFTVLGSSTTSSVYGQPVTLTAGVRPASPGDGAPTGDVDFIDTTTGTDLGTAPLINGASTLVTSTLAVGSHTIAANYQGDRNFAFSLSSLTQAVAPDRSTTTASSSASTSRFGQPVTLTATITANAPGAGTPTGRVDFYDTTTSTDLTPGSLPLASGTATFSIASLPVGTSTITVSYSGDGNFIPSSAGAGTITITPSLIVLDPTAGGALSLSGNASVALAGGVFVDSGSSSAVSASGNAQITSSLIDVHGQIRKSGNASFNPTPVTGASPLADPLASLAPPGTSGMTSWGSVSLGGNSSATINPGTYTKITVSGNARLTLNSGTYIIEGGGFSSSGNASVSGSGVTIVNVGSTYPATGGTYGSISVSGNGSYSLSPPASGTYAES